MHLMACKQFEASENSGLQLANFFKDEIQFLQSHALALDKKLWYRQQPSHVLLKKVNWEQELKPFLDIKYPVAAQLKDYHSQQIILDSSASLIKLTALNENAQYQFVQILLLKKQIVAITVYANKSQLLSHSSSFLRYQSKKNYQIQVNNQLRSFSNIFCDIRGKFIFD